MAPSWGRATGRFALFLLMTALLVPVYLVVYPLSPPARQAIVRLWFRGACRLCALTVRVTGAPCRDGATLLVANHVSYLDVPVIGSLLDVVFVAKQEVATWPLFGPLARLARTAFIGRKASTAARQAGDLAARLKAGESLLAFPEGTSTDGSTVRPFKTALFAVAEAMPADQPLRVQPVSISYPRTAAGKSLNGGLQDLYAWYGDMTLLPHLLTVFGLKGADVEVIFHQPVLASDFVDRKDLAWHCRAEVALGVSMAMGRWRTAIPERAGTPVIPSAVGLDRLAAGDEGEPALDALDPAVAA